MNVAYFTTKIDTNLVFNQVLRLVKEMRDAGVNIILYSFEENGSEYYTAHKFLKENGIPFHRIREHDELRKVRRLRDLLEKDKIRIIHCRSYDMGILAAGHFRTYKIIFDVRGLLPYEIFQIRRDTTDLQRMLAGEGKLVSLCDNIVCVNRGMTEYFEERYGRKLQGKLIEIPVHYCHYDDERCPPPAQRLDGKYLWVTFAGSLTAYYRLENIFRLFYQLREKDEAYRLLILSNQVYAKKKIVEYCGLEIDPGLFEIYSVDPELTPYYLGNSKIGLDPFSSDVDVLNRVRLAVKTVEYIKHDLPIVAPNYYPFYNELKREGYPILMFTREGEIDFSGYELFLRNRPDPLIKERYDIRNTVRLYITLYQDLMRN